MQVFALIFFFNVCAHALRRLTALKSKGIDFLLLQLLPAAD
jgi:hypothetical protein